MEQAMEQTLKGRFSITFSDKEYDGFIAWHSFSLDLDESTFDLFCKILDDCPSVKEWEWKEREDE